MAEAVATVEAKDKGDPCLADVPEVIAVAVVGVEIIASLVVGIVPKVVVRGVEAGLEELVLDEEV